MAISRNTMKFWHATHKWSSLICTVFLLMLCITGLPLIFHAEIDELSLPEFIDIQSEKQASLAAIEQLARAEKPDWPLIFLFWDDSKPMISAVLGTSVSAGESDVLIAPFDRRTGERLSAPAKNEGLMAFILDLHASMLMGLPGTLFLGLMGLIFFISIISGIVVYAPYIKRLSFATVRRNKDKNIKRLDTHNMVGIITVSWVCVVTISGIILTLVTPLTAIWQNGELAKIKAQYENIAPLKKYVSPDIVLANVMKEVPDANIAFMSWPGSPYATPYHYTLGWKGNTPLTEHLLKVALIDANTGEISSMRETPWYLDMINISVPLHFGDYGGLPLKILWAMLNIMAIIVLWTGLLLWLKKHKKVSADNTQEIPQNALIELEGLR